MTVLIAILTVVHRISGVWCNSGVDVLAVAMGKGPPVVLQQDTYISASR